MQIIYHVIINELDIKVWVCADGDTTLIVAKIRRIIDVYVWTRSCYYVFLQRANQGSLSKNPAVHTIVIFWHHHYQPCKLVNIT